VITPGEINALGGKTDPVVIYGSLTLTPAAIDAIGSTGPFLVIEYGDAKYFFYYDMGHSFEKHINKIHEYWQKLNFKVKN
jgi:hypothetical protein